MTIRFFERSAYTTHNTPDTKRTFFQNYLDHLFYLEESALIDFMEVMEKKDPGYLTQKAAKHNTIFKPFRDRFDYLDDVLGATVTPMAFILGATTLLNYALYEGAIALAIKTKLRENDFKNHGVQASLFIAGAFLCFALSLAIFLKSVVSLITRPLVTAYEGYQEQDTPRFYQ